MKWCVVDNSEYLAFFIPSTCFAMAPASLPARLMWDGSKVSGQVASQTKMRLLFQGRIVAPSGLLPSDLQIPTGSRWADILADPKHLLTMSLMVECQGCHPRLFLQYSDITKIQNNLMRSFLGVSRNVPIAALLGDMGWLPITTIIKISCIGFWIRLNNMANSRLNKQIFIEADNLASNKGYKNWIAHTRRMLRSYSSDYNPAPTLSSN